MRKTALALAALFATLASPTLARADDAGDRTAAIRACRAEVVDREGVSEDRVRLDQVRVRARVVRVDLDLWRNGALENIRCEVNRTGGATVATITQPAQAVAAR